MKDTPASLLLIVCVTLAFLLGMAWGCELHYRSICREAVKRGAAEYRVDDKGKVTFHWKTTEPK